MLNLRYIFKVFTPLESPVISGGDHIDKILIPYRKGGVKAPSFLTGFTKSIHRLKEYFIMASIDAMGKHLKIACLGREILVSIIFVCRKWRVESGFFP